VTSVRLLARNSALNVVGQLAPLVVALVTIPMLIRGFGAERFGILTLVWAVIGYFGLFELGLGRALTQAVAQRFGTSRERELPDVARAGLLLLLALGMIAGLVVLGLATVLATRVLSVPEELRAETVDAFRILAAALPFVLATAGLRGLMEGHQHFGLAALLRVPAALFSYAGPLVTLPFSRSLVVAVAVIAAGRGVIFAAHLAICLRAYPYLRARASGDAVGGTFGLLRFGAWMTVSNIVSPAMVYLDRFLIGATLGLASVTAYVTPYEGVSKLLIIPGALAGAMLPALTSTAAHPERMGNLYEKSLRAIALVMFPIALISVTLAREGLFLWVGAALPAASAEVLQWLAVGVFVSGLAHAPAAALQSAGAPDVIAKLHVMELPIYAGMLAVLLPAFGLTGVAMAWTARAALDAVALSWLVRRRLGLVLLPRLGGPWVLAAMLALIAAGALLPSTGIRIAYALAVCSAFTALAWYVLLTASERTGVRSWIADAASRGATTPSV
jgi:O-antigen/teichoic acid export membrane protein